ncbi:globin domain-containing protein [Streptomyces thermolilacinus]|uniref:globin domain-containing protein n=1 Tax=Streptomyces thermolilacinus TaxID=285540 RepID=UPI000417E081|nr:globin domain-containing protein [Streptomyces thermolilacinus]
MNDDYHALLARREAMRLRDQLLAPASRGAAAHSASYASPGPRTAASAPGAYDGAADQELIVRNLGLVTPFDALIAHLYDAMFERHPYLRKLFPESMEFQRAHLGRAFWYLIENLDRPEQVDAFCTRLGRDHRKLGVLPVHYEVFKVALEEALQRYAGGRLGADVTDAWLRMVRFAAAGMVRGANEALAEPAYWTADVTRHERRGRDVAVLRVRPSAPYPYRPGQYATLQSPLLPLTWRPYSMAGAPGGDGELEFHIRRTGPDGVSDALVTDTGVGDTLRLGPAQGTTTLDGELTRDVLVVAGGTGWATAKALLEDFAARRPPGRSAHLFLGARSADDLYDAPALVRLESRCPWLRVVRVLDDGPGGSGGSGGSGHRSVVDAPARHGDFGGHVAYVSGPPAMVTATAWHLSALGLPPDLIRHDPVPDTSAPVHAR